MHRVRTYVCGRPQLHNGLGAVHAAAGPEEAKHHQAKEADLLAVPAPGRRVVARMVIGRCRRCRLERRLRTHLHCVCGGGGGSGWQHIANRFQAIHVK